MGILVAALMVMALLPVAAAAQDDFGACGDPFTPIYDIQGDGEDSPLDGEEGIVTEGWVTVDLQGEDQLSGFFIQDRLGDGNPATSDGIFVSHRDTWSPSFDPSVGDLVRVRGEIDEQFGNTQIEFITDGAICRSGGVPIATVVDARTYTANAESYEGMFVRIPGKHSVTDTFNLHRFGEVWVADKSVVEQPTNEFPVGPDAAAFAEDNMARSFLVDDGSTSSDPRPVPYFRDGDTLRLGDITTKIKGAVNYSFGQYRIQPQDTADLDFRTGNRRTNPPRMRGNVTVASFNVLNYWTTLGGRGADDADQLEVQTDKLVAAISAMNPDIVGLQEVENDLTHTPIVTLLDALNDAAGADVWSWIGELDYYNLYPIRNEILYRNDRVSAVGDPVTIADPIFDEIPPGRDDPLGRPPVAQTFEYHGEYFTVVNNHFKSKSCSGATGGDADMADGQACWNPTRVGQAERVLEFVDELIADTGDSDVLVIGDLNSYLDEDPVLAFENELINLVREWDNDPYSFNFFASFSAPWIGRGLLDYAFATPSMDAQVRRTVIWHINADEPRVLDWFDTSITAPGPYRSSDHDPVIVSLSL